MASLSSATFAIGLVRRRPALRLIRSAVSTFSGSGANNEPPSLLPRQLVLYTKPGCCLCDALKEKLQAALSLDGPHSLHFVQLQVRDISGNTEWEKKYQYEIPVLAKVLSDGREETLPRISSRLGVELIQRKIAAALER